LSTITSLGWCLNDIQTIKIADICLTSQAALVTADRDDARPDRERINVVTQLTRSLAPEVFHDAANLLHRVTDACLLGL
jgi:hypothetical protein